MSSRVTFSAWPMTPSVKRILIALSVTWLVSVILYRFGDSFDFLISMVPEDFVKTTTGDSLFGLSMPVENRHIFGSWMITHLGMVPRRFLPGMELWQPFTYMWLHSLTDFSHVLFNGLFLWMFGGTLERDWGSRAFWKFYLICGVGAGLVVFVVGSIVDADVPTIGASGAIYGLVAAWVIVNPNRLVYLFGVFPIKGKYFAMIPIGYALLDFIVGGTGVSHSAHLGGLAIGALLVTGYWRPRKIYNRLRYKYMKSRLKTLEGGAGSRKPPPPGGGYWH